MAPLTPTQVAELAVRERDQAVGAAYRAIDELASRLADAKTALVDAAAGKPYHAGHLDLYGNAHTAVAKELARADTLINMAALTERMLLED